MTDRGKPKDRFKTSPALANSRKRPKWRRRSRAYQRSGFLHQCKLTSKFGLEKCTYSNGLVTYDEIESPSRLRIRRSSERSRNRKTKRTGEAARADCKKAQAPETRSLRILYFPPRASKLAQIGNFARSGTGLSGARPTSPSMSAILSICTNRKNGFQQFFRDRANSQAGVFPRHHHQQSKAPLRSRSLRQ